MADPVASSPGQGPYTSTETKVLKIAESVTFTTQRDASHVPPSGPFKASSGPPPHKDPYKDTETKTFKIAGPIELTLTTTFHSSHVPPPRAADGDEDGGGLMDVLQPLAQMILVRLDEIRSAQRGPQEPS
jgi:hypothetical protein